MLSVGPVCVLWLWDPVWMHQLGASGSLLWQDSQVVCLVLIFQCIWPVDKLFFFFLNSFSKISHDIYRHGPLPPMPSPSPADPSAVSGLLLALLRGSEVS